MRTRAYLKIISAMLIWGTLGIFTRHTGVSSSEMVLFRVVIGGVFLLVVYLFSRRHSSGSAIRRAAPLLLLSGIVMGFNWLFLRGVPLYHRQPCNGCILLFSHYRNAALSPAFQRAGCAAQGNGNYVLSWGTCADCRQYFGKFIHL